MVCLGEKELWLSLPTLLNAFKENNYNSLFPDMYNLVKLVGILLDFAVNQTESLLTTGTGWSKIAVCVRVCVQDNLGKNIFVMGVMADIFYSAVCHSSW